MSSRLVKATKTKKSKDWDWRAQLRKQKECFKTTVHSAAPPQINCSFASSAPSAIIYSLCLVNCYHLQQSSFHSQSVAKLFEHHFLQFLFWPCPSCFKLWQCPHLYPSTCHNAARFLNNFQTNLNMSLSCLRILTDPPSPIILIFKNCLAPGHFHLLNQYFLKTSPI